MFNTIILLKGDAVLSKSEYKKFEKGDTIWGDGSEAQELKRWSIEQEPDAKKELSRFLNTYRTNHDIWSIEEYALEYCDCDDDGEFVFGSDYEPAVDLEDFVSRIVDMLACRYSELSDAQQKDMEKNASLYVNDYTCGVCDTNGITDKWIIREIMDKVEDEFDAWLAIE